MSTYDTLRFPDAPPDGEQVKVWWCELRDVAVGDEVPPVGGHETYGIVLRCGGVALVDGGKLAGWRPDLPPDPTERPRERPLFDKWGNTWIGNLDNTGMMGEPYFATPAAPAGDSLPEKGE